MGIFVALLTGALHTLSPVVSAPLQWGWDAWLVLATLSLGVRRLHDTGRRGTLCYLATAASLSTWALTSCLFLTPLRAELIKVHYEPSNAQLIRILEGIVTPRTALLIFLLCLATLILTSTSLIVQCFAGEVQANRYGPVPEKRGIAEGLYWIYATPGFLGLILAFITFLRSPAAATVPAAMVQGACLLWLWFLYGAVLRQRQAPPA
jgi:uncharacterized membrane protein YhaH (DUF805 family)